MEQKLKIQKWIDKKDIPKNLTTKQAENWKNKVQKLLDQQLKDMTGDLSVECEILLDNTSNNPKLDSDWRDSLEYWKKEIRETMKHVISLRKQIEKNRRK